MNKKNNMKTKKILTIISLCSLFIITSVFNLSIAKELAIGIEKPADPNWLKNHRRVIKPVRDSITVSVDFSADGTGSGSVEVEANQTWVYVNCCKFTRKPYYWCNASLQDSRC